MAKTMTAATVADDTQYIVRLTRAVKVGRTWLRPGDAETRLKGSVIKEIADAVGAIHEVAG
jgi:hypothetical protein